MRASRETVSFRTRENGVAEILLDRPHKKNAMTVSMWDDLYRVVVDLEGDKSRIVVVAGAEGGFCAGSDIGDLESRGITEALAGRVAGVLQLLAGVDAVTIAAIDGPALGGGLELALACDIRIATERAILGSPELKHGVLPGAGAIHRLPEIVGPTLAADMILAGRTLDGHEARTSGLVSRVVKPADLQREVDQLCRRLSDMQPLPLSLARDALRSQRTASAAQALLERTMQATCYARKGEAGHL